MQDILNCLQSAILEAGTAIVKLQQGELNIQHKTNLDVVTDADLAANEILRTRLLSAYPNHGWVSEENADDASRLHKSRFWLVDPIDGTREFIRGSDEYAISVALIENSQPILAGVYNPARQQLFTAIKNQGAYLNGSRIVCRQLLASPLTILASRSEYAKGKWQPFLQQHIQPVGSIAYKLGLVAAGQADATFSLGPKHEWDIAAGALLIEEANGKVSDLDYKPFVFNQQNLKVAGIIATSTISYQPIQQLINDHR